jgi:hypothetical protein
VVPTTPTTPDGMVKIGETYVLGAKAKAYIYAKQAIFTGYNTIYVAMYDSADGSTINRWTISFNSRNGHGNHAA